MSVLAYSGTEIIKEDSFFGFGGSMKEAVHISELVLSFTISSEMVRRYVLRIALYCLLMSGRYMGMMS